jgi:hypothetical protein
VQGSDEIIYADQVQINTVPKYFTLDFDFDFCLQDGFINQKHWHRLSFFPPAMPFRSWMDLLLS